MGAFVCKFNKFVDTSFNQYILIDGQQRLTSITLLLTALHDHFKKIGDKYEEMRSEIKETYLINKFAKDSNLKLKLKSNQVDNDSFTRLMDDEDVSGIETNIIRNYNKFYEWLGKEELGDYYKDDGQVFSHPDGRRITTQVFNKWFKQVRDKAGIPDTLLEWCLFLWCLWCPIKELYKTRSEFLKF